MKRKIKRDHRLNLLSKMTKEQIKTANKMSKKSRGISKLTLDDIYSEDEIEEMRKCLQVSENDQL